MVETRESHENTIRETCLCSDNAHTADNEADNCTCTYKWFVTLNRIITSVENPNELIKEKE